jgi:PAS domain S-box-containing protein
VTPQHWIESIHPEDRAKVQATLDDPSLASQPKMEYRIIRPDGGIRWISDYGFPIHDAQGSIRWIAGVARDVTESRRVEEALRQSEARLRLAVETAELGLYDRDLIRNEVVMNTNCRRIMGLPAQGALNPDVAVASLHPEDRNQVLPLVARAFDPQLREVARADFRIITPQGQVRWVSGQGRVIFDDTTDPPRSLRFIGVLQDISSRKELELEIEHSRTELQRYAQDLEERVAERTAHLQQTIESLEGVLYHVAHDLRAPLRAMHSFSNILVRNYADKLDPPGADFARRIAESSVKMDALIRDLLIYGRMGHQTVAWSSVDLDALFDRLLSELNPEITVRRAEIQLQKPLPRVWGDPKILEQVIANLLTNALKFTPMDTPPRIDVWGELADGTVSIWIRDQGIGIAAEYYERIFGIFERLHETETYPGTGIGLAIVKKGIDLLGGRVQVESEVGQGSRFVLKLKSTPHSHEQRSV